MRIQYHSRMVNGHRHIWDVLKLVEMTRDFPVKNVALSDIKELDEDYWYDGDSPPPTPRSVAVHAMLIQACDMDYPIILDSKGRIMDGMHRCCRALIEKREHIQAVQFESDPEPHYIDEPFENLPQDAPVSL